MHSFEGPLRLTIAVNVQNYTLESQWKPLWNLTQIIVQFPNTYTMDHYTTGIPLYITVPDISIMCLLVVSVAYLIDDSVVVERDNRKKLDTL